MNILMKNSYGYVKNSYRITTINVNNFKQLKKILFWTCYNPEEISSVDVCLESTEEIKLLDSVLQVTDIPMILKATGLDGIM